MPEKEEAVAEENAKQAVKDKSKIIVMRFGGSSISTPEAIKAVAEHIKERVEAGYKIVAVVSANPTERVKAIKSAQKIDHNTLGRYLNALIQSYDAASGILLCIALHKLGINSRPYNGHLIAIKRLRPGHYFYSVEEETISMKADLAMLKSKLNKAPVVICSGFKVIEGDEKIIDEVILADSNSTAVVLTYLLMADLCEINTSTDGIYQVDPREVKNAARIAFLAPLQMRRFASLGARILSQRCVDLAASLNITIQVQLSPALGKSTGGTIISFTKPENLADILEAEAGLAINSNVVRLNISTANPDKLTEIFSALRNICLVDSSIDPKGKGYVVLPAEDAARAKKKIRRFKKATIKEERGLSSLTLVDWQMVDASGYVSKITKILGEMLVSLNTAGDSISILVRQANKKEAVRKLAEAFKLTKS